MITPTAVLVVDDSLTVRNIVVKSLRNLGFSDVDAAEDGKLALERMREKQYGLLISDWEMPNMSGEDFLKTVRRDPKCMKMPIIMITGTTTRGTSWLAGANAYLQKPFTDADFEKAVKSALSGH
ncbi:MAG TPA: response regulator [Xanthobacteraceae bacterium]|jgi:two-component system chemotaxis response regulator CheY|nr:response regulator [Xanthobacteraceae bacterium]